MIGLVSGGLILLGATGIYLWFMNHSERAIGAVLVAINLGICVTLLVLIRTASAPPRRAEYYDVFRK
jgi:hypothetical protein